MLQLWGMIFRPIKTSYGEIVVTNAMALRHFQFRLIPAPANDNLGDAA